MDQIDPWQVVPKQVFTPYFRLLISTAFVVVSRVDYLGVTGVGGMCKRQTLRQVKVADSNFFLRILC